MVIGITLVAGLYIVRFTNYEFYYFNNIMHAYFKI
jgi:hypothetical protein